jgi:hypothetical protein
MGKVDRSESAVWTTNGYAVAWIGWSLRHAPAACEPAASGEKEG